MMKVMTTVGMLEVYTRMTKKLELANDVLADSYMVHIDHMIEWSDEIWAAIETLSHEQREKAMRLRKRFSRSHASVQKELEQFLLEEDEITQWLVTASRVAKYASDGTRLTDCCGSYSTFHGVMLCCKVCWREVPPGQGDGSEQKPVEETNEGAHCCA